MGERAGRDAGGASHGPVGAASVAALLDGASTAWRTARLAVHARVTLPWLAGVLDGTAAHLDALGVDPFDATGTRVDLRADARAVVERVDPPPLPAGWAPVGSPPVVDLSPVPPFAPTTRFRVDGEAVIGGRPWRGVRARDGWRWWPQVAPRVVVHHDGADPTYGLGTGWPGWLLQPDAERGVLLRLEVHERAGDAGVDPGGGSRPDAGPVVCTVEVTEVVFDRPVDPNVFRVEVPVGRRRVPSTVPWRHRDPSPEPEPGPTGTVRG